MSPRVIHLEAAAPAKPPWGAPCNGCGVCCASEPCPLGVLLSRRRQGPCVALRWNAALGLYRCAAVAEPASVWPRWPAPLQRGLGRLARRWIASGQGCDAALEAAPADDGPLDDPAGTGPRASCQDDGRLRRRPALPNPPCE